MKTFMYLTAFSFNELFNQWYVWLNFSNNIIFCGKYPPLDRDMPSNEPNNNTDN